jgi:allantoicase
MKYQSLRTILALACEEGMHIHRMDVKTAFLNGNLEEEVYMEQTEFMVKEGQSESVEIEEGSVWVETSTKSLEQEIT